MIPLLASWLRGARISSRHRTRAGSRGGTFRFEAAIFLGSARLDDARPDRERTTNVFLPH
jgi:hypothetical protein